MKILLIIRYNQNYTNQLLYNATLIKAIKK